MPLTFIPPQLPTLASEVPVGPDWEHEIKHDGYRTQIHVQSGAARIFTRNGHDWTEKYRPTARVAEQIVRGEAVWDGEMIVQDSEGRSDFAAFRRALDRRPEDLVFMAFDLLSLDGEDLRRQPLAERRTRLQEVLGPNDPGRPIQFSESVAQGAELFEAADRMGLEGIVSKRMRCPYRSGASRDWLKIKCWTSGTFVLVGVIQGGEAPCALVARRDGDELRYVGSAIVALAGAERAAFWEAVSMLARPTPPLILTKPISATWLEPRIELAVRSLRGSDKLRHATVSGITGLIAA